MKVLWDEFSGEKLVAKIERMVDEHKKAGEKYFIRSSVISDRTDLPPRYEITFESPIRGSVTCFVFMVDGNITEAADRAYYKALLLLGY